MSQAMPARMRRLYARRDDLLQQIESIDLEIRTLERATGIRGKNGPGKRPAPLHAVRHSRDPR